MAKTKGTAGRTLKQPRAVATRSDILDAAIRLFARQGTVSTPMTALAREVGLTTGALYWHFPAKEDLLLAAIEELQRRYVTAYEEDLLAARSLTARQQLESFLERTRKFLSESPDHGIFFGALAAESLYDRPAARALRAALVQFAQNLGGILRYGQLKTGEFREDVEPSELAHALLFANVGVVLNDHLFGGQLAYGKLIAALHRTIVDGVLKR